MPVSIQTTFTLSPEVHQQVVDFLTTQAEAQAEWHRIYKSPTTKQDLVTILMLRSKFSVGSKEITA